MFRLGLPVPERFPADSGWFPDVLSLEPEVLFSGFQSPDHAPIQTNHAPISGSCLDIRRVLRKIRFRIVRFRQAIHFPVSGLDLTKGVARSTRNREAPLEILRPH